MVNIDELLPKAVLYELVSLSSFAFSFSVILVAVLSYLRRKDMMTLRFLIFSVIVTFWGIFFALWTRQSYDVALLLTFTRLSHAFAVFMPVTWVHFILVFTSRKEPFKTFLLTQYLLAFALFVCSPTEYFIPRMHSVGEFQYYLSAGPIYHLFTIDFFGMVIYGFYELIRFYKNARDLLRIQARHLIIATIIGFIAGGATFLPVYGIAFPMTIITIMPLYPFFVGFALIRHGLFDVEEIVKAAQKEKLAALGVLSASINHEIKSPLYVVKELIQMNLKELDTPGCKAEELVAKGKDHLGRAARQIDRIYDTIRRLSKFAKQGVQNQPELQAVSINQVLDTVEDLIRYDFSVSNIKLIRKIDKDAEEITSDMRYLEEILFNLIVNAGQALSKTGEGGQITVKTRKEGGKFILSVEDNGPSIPRDKLDQIFEPFYTTKKEGSGLGLYVTKQLVERMNGKIEVQSNRIEGTSFTLKF